MTSTNNHQSETMREGGHIVDEASSSAASASPAAPIEWPALEYEDGYPVDEDTLIHAHLARPLNIGAAARWVFNELQAAAQNMPACSCEVSDGDDHGTPIKIIKFSTGGWSGAETVLGLIESRYDCKFFMQSWRRGGHYTFHFVPRFLALPNDGKAVVPSHTRPVAPDCSAQSTTSTPERS